MPQLRTARILWGALLASTGVYLVLLLTVRPEMDHAPHEPFLFPALAVAALGAAVASFIIPASLYRQNAARAKLDCKEETVQDPVRAGSDVLPYRETATRTRKVAAKPEVARRRAFVLYQTAMILELALAEAVCLLGFVLGWLGFPILHVLPFFVVAWVLFALRFPTLERAIAPLERAQGVHIPRA